MADWLRAHLPDWLVHQTFLLENWQWLGLLALALLGLILGAIVRVLFFSVGVRLARARGLEIEKDRKLGRPFALIGQAALWYVALPWLDLPAGAEGALTLAARFVLMVGVVWSVCRILDWIAAYVGTLAQRTATRLDDLLVPMLRRALKVFAVAIGIVWIAANLGQDVGALLAGLGIGGVAIALASKDTVENFFGALAIVIDRPFQVGDWIRLGDIEGTVEEVGFRSTRVRTFYNSLITFPNAMLIRQEVDNLGARRWRRIRETIGVAYDTPPDHLEAFVEGIREIIRRHPYTRKDYYHVYLHGFGDSALDIMLYLFVGTPDWGTELRERQRFFLDILRLAKKLGVEFAFPTRTLHLIQGEPREPGGTFASIAEAHQGGRTRAKEVVDEFTGPGVPPPVDIRKRPDDEADGDGGS
ncbi:MAG: mechanosensitive ion channel family protein [Planctomycetota bacterium]|jgi:MscS family membrane protein